MTTIRNILALNRTVPTYQSIEDFPVFNWFKINETNDLVWLLLDKKDWKYADQKKMEQLWENIFCEFIDTFGIPDKMREILSLKRDIAVMNWDIVLTGDRSLTAIIAMKELELKELLNQENSEKNLSVNQAKVYVEKYMGFRLDLKEVSVKDYYTYVNAYKAEIASKNRQNVE